MTDIDKKRFDEILRGDKYLENVSDVDMLRTACECEKLYAYIISEVPDVDIKELIHLAYWWGVLNAHKRPLTNRDVAKLIMGWDIP